MVTLVSFVHNLYSGEHYFGKEEIIFILKALIGSTVAGALVALASAVALWYRWRGYHVDVFQVVGFGPALVQQVPVVAPAVVPPPLPPLPPPAQSVRGVPALSHEDAVNSPYFVHADLLAYLRVRACLQPREGLLQKLSQWARVWQAEHKLTDASIEPFLAPTIARAFMLSPAEQQAVELLNSEPARAAVNLFTKASVHTGVRSRRWQTWGQYLLGTWCCRTRPSDIRNS
jgi:hypothetical protein